MARRTRADRAPIVHVNDRPVGSARPGETLLATALREGVPFPNGCRVGACGACRCRVREGEVRELTESGYLLSAEELDQGVVLACQSVPRSDVHLEVDLAAGRPRRPAPAGGAGARRSGRAPAAPAGMLHYAKYFLFHAVGLAALAALVAGGRPLVATFLAIVTFYVIGDALAGDDASTPAFGHPAVLTAQLWLALPLLVLIVFASVWSVCAGDPLGFGAWISRWSGHDVLAARAATTPGEHVAGWLVTGLMIGMVGTIPAHELTHRTWDRVSMAIGRWLLAFSLDTAFAIEHVHGHHRYVATVDDPATAPRGRSVYAQVVVSTIRGNVSAWRIEARRLAKRRRPVLSVANAFLRGQLLSAALVGGAFAMGGARAAAWFTACALWGKALLEIVNYMEHYGLVRAPAAPVKPRHSWNSNRRISSWSTFNLTRHSHHHAQGEVPYQDLRPIPRAPLMISGYLTTIVVTLVPPLWHALMAPKLLAWDREHASAEERALASRANERSGPGALGASA
jgi:alkane 1-monooxygenase